MRNLSWRSVTIAVGAATLGAALTAISSSRPVGAQRTQYVETNGRGRYELQVLSPQQWLVLDTHTGELRRWSAGSSGQYVVETVDLTRRPAEVLTHQVITPNQK